MKRQYGFGLIEVMLAFVIVAATAGTLLQLNKTYLEYSRDGRSREVAIRLAESKLDELRRFQTRSGFDAIVGGSDSISLDSIDYARSWTVTAYAWNSASSAWKTTSSSDNNTGKKQVVVTVNWTDAGSSRSFSLESLLSPNLPASGGPFGSSGNKIGLGLGGPKVSHVPGSIPDIISIELDPATGVRQETTKPAPDIQTGKYAGDVVVSFENVIFDPSSNSLINGDSRTLHCSCESKNGTQLTARPAAPVVLTQSIYWRAGNPVSKLWGDSKNNNPDCQTCCVNHYDVPSSNLLEDNYNQFNKGHVHSSGNYYESCRMLRIDGYYRVMPDWNLVALNVFPPGYLSNAGNVALYQEYIKYVVKDYVEEMKAGTHTATYQPDSFRAWLGSNKTAVETAAFDSKKQLYASYSYQFAARAIYVDLLPQTLLDKVDFSEDNWLSRVSFNEVNVTLLASWSVTGADYLVVRNDPIKTIIDLENDYFGTYLRGYVKALKTTLTPAPEVVASLTRYNTGLTGKPAISSFDGSNAYSAGLGVTVLPGSPATTTFGGEVQCLTVASQNSSASKPCSKNDFNKTQLAVNNGNCTLNKEADVATATFQCTVPVTETSVNLMFSETSNNSNFVFNGDSGSGNPFQLTLDQEDLDESICVLQIHNGVENYQVLNCGN
ncbi:prepilin-type N-terminal cleavage/methylation domain-containing protein [Oceanimonas pelagia]|uniref:Prepilin-type N-terminal cleavage/methylation domain-containing protein n=1 Tax=Oceanimonas pelagia TaxID=3028314 RepID=A0AA50Q9F1_9GAMM|nr:prepilin-type N-terminal cleavage/methylation domain-containing protein [Oceanimonas pelagia]WMC10028.1 prepilin-type N-terminal cleavage/methylation domain-containing protein [Oceanimonas pelagia]